MRTTDALTLRGLASVKVAATWVPWTSGRLARASGYGAGVTSPGWYHHLFTAPDDVVLRWLVRVAGLLREARLDVSSASVIEAVRLAEALATIRGRPLAGLAEVMESTQAVLCGGSEVPVQLVSRQLLVGDLLGRVPDETPMVPLARDLAALQKRLRLKPSTVAQSDANRGAAWLDGFLSGDAVLLLHEPELLAMIGSWVTGVRREVFDDLLPLRAAPSRRSRRPSAGASVPHPAHRSR